MRHEIVAQQQEGRVEEGLQGGGPALVLLLAGEAQQILDDVRCPLGLLLDHRQRLPERRRYVGHLGQIVGEAHHRRERVIQVVRDAGNELADGGHLLRLDQLVLKPATLGLVIEEKDHRGSVRAADGDRTDRVGTLSGAKLDLAARSLLVQGPLKLGGPLGRRKRLPRAADQAGGRGVDQVGEGPIGPPDAAPDPRCRSPARWRPPPPATNAGRRRGDPPAGRFPGRCWPGSPGPPAGRGPPVRSDPAHCARRSLRLLYSLRPAARTANCPPDSGCAGKVPSASRESSPSGSTRAPGGRRAPAIAAGSGLGAARRAGNPARPRRDERGRARSRSARDSLARGAAERPPPRRGAACRPAHGRRRSLGVGPPGLP